MQRHVDSDVANGADLASTPRGRRDGSRDSATPVSALPLAATVWRYVGRSRALIQASIAYLSAGSMRGMMASRSLLEQAHTRGRGLATVLRPAWEIVEPYWTRLDGWRAAVGHWLAQTRIGRFLSKSVAYRILFTNLLGLMILLLGVLHHSFDQSFVIKARVDELRTRADIIAAALATKATGDQASRISLEERLAESGTPLMPFREEGIAALELSLRPDRIAPVLAQLIRPTQTKTRARVYGTSGALIVDSSILLEKGQIARSNTRPEADDERPRLRNNWHRFLAWLSRSELPVYRDIGSANGVLNYAEVRTAMKGTPIAMLLMNERYEQIVSIAVPIQHRHDILGVLLLSTRPGEIDEIIWSDQKNYLRLAVIPLIVMMLASILMARWIAYPVRRLSAAANDVSHSLTARAKLPDYSDRRDEIGQLSTAFHNMTNALYRRIEASEKFAADVAHELKNPVAAARSIAESMHYARTDEAREEAVRQIQGELKRLNRLISDVSNASRLDAELALQETEPVDIRAVLGGVVESFNALMGDGRVELEVTRGPAGAYVVDGHEGRLAQVVTNLVDNALSFSPEDGVVSVHARSTDGRIEIVIDDVGPGIPEDKLDKIFERFYSDRPQSDSTKGKNSGLGLSITREIVLAHGGSIRAQNRWPDGVAPLPATGVAVGRGKAVAKGPSVESVEKPVRLIPRGARFIVALPTMPAAALRAAGPRKGT